MDPGSIVHGRTVYNSRKTEMKLIIVENLQKLKMLFNVDCPNVKTVVLMNSKPDDNIPTKAGKMFMIYLYGGTKLGL